MVGDGACCTLEGAICAGLYGYTLVGYTTDYTLRAGSDVHVITVGNGF